MAIAEANLSISEPTEELARIVAELNRVIREVNRLNDLLNQKLSKRDLNERLGDELSGIVKKHKDEVVLGQWCFNDILCAESNIRLLPKKFVTASTTMAITDFAVDADATAGAITVRLPLASGSTFQTGSGMLMFIKKTDTSANTVTILASGADTLDFVGSSRILQARGDGMLFHSDGKNNWEKMAETLRAFAADSISLNKVFVTGSDTALITDFTIGMLTNGPTVLTLLPASTHVGQLVVIRKDDKVDEIVTVKADGTDTIEERSEAILGEFGDAIMVQADAFNNWQIIANSPGFDARHYALVLG